MSAHPTLVLLALGWITFVAIVGSAFGIYRSLGGEPWRPVNLSDSPFARVVYLSIDAANITAWYVVLSLAWGAR